ncbi:e2765032-1c4b-4285-87e1-12d2c09b1225 [Sclerotinia trifoliorum]|uniref:Signal recognition particle subunit SRP14 n=1 Tax=Sclerotinia trifoliorum TaxID=28548 RepID=A0A8H2ZQL2_9HELO|nr:e2765032-1c4b-4285-87e1-12d2c09b1225 [Sclerotinia trifoliorum]
MVSHLSNDEFFSKLASLFDIRRDKDHGSVTLTQKCFSYGPASDTSMAVVRAADALSDIFTAQFPDLSRDAPVPLLIRATNSKGKLKRGEKIKLSTVVQPDQLEGFFARYAEICKGGMGALKKRDKKQAKEKLKAKKRKMGTTTVPPGEEKK